MGYPSYTLDTALFVQASVAELSSGTSVGLGYDCTECNSLQRTQAVLRG